jgi:hypothetical protein
MAGFCKGCSTETFGEDYGDFAGLCDPGDEVTVLCESCGIIGVDHLGNRLWKAKPVGLDKESATAKMLHILHER